MNTLKEMVNDGKKAKFVRYYCHQMWYQTECGFMFPVPLSDNGAAVLEAEEKALLLMRYIKAHIKLTEQAQAAGYGPADD